MGTLQWGVTGTISGVANNNQGNAIAAALASANQGASAPTPASTGLAATSGVIWHDTTNNILKLRDQADANWINIGNVDETNKTFNAMLRSYLAGLTLSNDGVAPNTKIDVAAGVAMDDTNVALLSLAAGSIDCTTTGANGLDTGALAATTLYHFFVIAKPGGASPALLASTSISAPTFPSGYTLKRRIGSLFTDGSAHFRGFVQVGDWFFYKNTALDANAVANSTTPANVALAVPSGAGLSVMARLIVDNGALAAGQSLWVYTPLMSDEVASTTEAYSRSSSANHQPGQIDVMTDTGGHVRIVADGTVGTYSIRTLAYMDYRGRQG